MAATSLYYCRACADSLGLLAGVYAPTTSPSTYQVDKCAKHTRLSTVGKGMHSVLASQSTAEYDDLARSAYDIGIVEMEPSGKRTLLHRTTGYLGPIFRDGATFAAGDTFKWVNSTAIDRAHGFLESSRGLVGMSCASCSVALSS